MRNYRLIQTRPEFDDAMDLSWSLIFSHQIHSFLQAIWSSVHSTPEVSDKLIGYFSLFKRRTIYASRNKWSYVTVQSYSELIRFLLRMPVRLINESLLLFALKWLGFLFMIWMDHVGDRKKGNASLKKFSALCTHFVRAERNWSFSGACGSYNNLLCFL